MIADRMVHTQKKIWVAAEKVLRNPDFWLQTQTGWSAFRALYPEKNLGIARLGAIFGPNGRVREHFCPVREQFRMPDARLPIPQQLPLSI